MGSRRFATTVVTLSWIALLGPPAEGQSIETLTVSGLEQGVEIVKDRWGISHIYAQTEHDLFFAQGYSAARDRLFQFELWRAQATGTTAELLGARAIDRDHGTRLFRFRGDLAQEMNHYHDRGAEIIPAFVDGVNAFIESALAKPRRPSPSFPVARDQAEVLDAGGRDLEAPGTSWQHRRGTEHGSCGLRHRWRRGEGAPVLPPP